MIKLIKMFMQNKEKKTTDIVDNTMIKSENVLRNVEKSNTIPQNKVFIDYKRPETTIAGGSLKSLAIMEEFENMNKEYSESEESDDVWTPDDELNMTKKITISNKEYENFEEIIPEEHNNYNKKHQNKIKKTGLKLTLGKNNKSPDQSHKTIKPKKITKSEKQTKKRKKNLVE
eukprot:UN25455